LWESDQVPVDLPVARTEPKSERCVTGGDICIDITRLLEINAGKQAIFIKNFTYFSVDAFENFRILSIYKNNPSRKEEEVSFQA